MDSYTQKNTESDVSLQQLLLTFHNAPLHLSHVHHHPKAEATNYALLHEATPSKSVLGVIGNLHQ